MEFQSIPLENLIIAKINARTHGATEGLDSLAASIRAQGVLQPLLVRPLDEAEGAGFEILEHYYRPDGKPRNEQPWLAIVSRKHR